MIQLSKKIKNNLNTIIVSLFAVMIMSCTNSYDEMITKFNHEFFTQERPVEDVYSVTSYDFDSETMLEEYYTFKKGYYINLEAPADATSYRWSYSDIEEKEDLITLSEQQYLYFNPTDVFKLNNTKEKSHSFKLVLSITVTGTEGTVTEYIDTSTITIIDQDETGHGGF